MVIVNEDKTYISVGGNERKGFYLDPNLQNNFDNYLIKGIKMKHDSVMIVSGPEGSGKSTLSMQLCKYVDPTFTHEDIVFSVQQLMDKIDNSTPGKAILFDESILGAGSSDALGKVANTLMKKMVVCRSKRLFIVFVIPSIFLLRMYFAVFRTRAMIHCYAKDGLYRGYFKFFSYNRKKSLYIKGKKFLNNNAETPNFHGNFTGTTVIDIDAYETAKQEALEKIGEDDEDDGKMDRGRKYKMERNMFMLLDYMRQKNQYNKRAMNDSTKGKYLDSYYISRLKNTFGIDLKQSHFSEAKKETLEYAEKNNFKILDDD